jgi:hypothetical protein
MTGPMRPHRVHVWPWLRGVGRLALPDWLAITLGRHVFAWRAMTETELRHELVHVDQWRAHGWRFPILYATESLRARRRGRNWYRDNRFEREARGERFPRDEPPA